MNATLLYILEGDNVFLARKKRNIGAGLWNGYGGKIEEGDLPIESIKKEFEKETSGATLKEEYLIPSAIINFFNHDNVSSIPNFKVLVYRIFSDKCIGKLKESDEMGAPKLFKSDDLPYDEMLPPDKDFLPRILEGEKFITNFQYSDAEKTSAIEFGYRVVKKEELVF